MSGFPQLKAAWLVVMSLVLISACSDDGPAPSAVVSKPIEVDSHIVGMRRLSDPTLSIGTLMSEESIEVTSNVTERIVELHFDDGQKVKRGDLLAQLASAEETAMLAEATARLDEEKREVARLTKLTRQNAVAKGTLDSRKTQEVVAKGRISQAEAMMADRMIKAPFDGVVGLRRISPGALVEPGTVITTLDKLDTMKLDFTVPEVFLGTLKSGVEINAKSSAFPERSFDGTISIVESRVDPVTRSVAVRAIIPNPDLILRPGMLMTVMLERNARDAIVIPERAISPVRDVFSVYQIDAEGIARKVELKLGRRIPGYVEVLEGLSVGDQIVTDGVIKLKDGAKVVVKGKFTAPAKGFDPTNPAQISE